MSKWQEKRFDSFIKLNRGFDLPDKYIVNGVYPVVASTNIKAYHISYKVAAPVVTTGRSGSLGTVQYINEKCTPLNTTLYVKDYKGNFPKFVYYFLQMMHLEQFNSGTGVPTLNQNHLHSYKILVPDLATQEKIADILSTYDDLIENNNRRIEILEQMAQEIYKEWFVRFRFPGHEKIKFKSIKMTNWIIGNDTISMIPNSWHIGNVNELALFKRGSNLTSANMINGNIPVISAGIQPAGYHNKANVFGQSITISASGANAGYLLYHLNDIWASDCSYLQSEYIWFIYNTLKFLQPVLSNLQCGAAQPHVYPKQINKIPIIIPTNEILKQYCSKVEPIYEYIKNLKEKNQNLIKQRDLLLPRLMSGKLEV